MEVIDVASMFFERQPRNLEPKVTPSQRSDELLRRMQQDSEALAADASPLLIDLRQVLLDDVAGALLLNHTPWKAMLQSIRQHFTSVGWEWNGLYKRVAPDRLELFDSAGPPVCQTLQSQGGVGTSGMCFDAILMNQTLSTNNVADWPGYVSCDTDSGLSTAASIVVPVHRADGPVWGVWDLDSQEPIVPSDAVFMTKLTALLATLAPIDD